MKKVDSLAKIKMKIKEVPIPVRTNLSKKARIRKTMLRKGKAFIESVEVKANQSNKIRRILELDV